jgi:hypothetical protein
MIARLIGALLGLWGWNDDDPRDVDELLLSR